MSLEVSSLEALRHHHPISTITQLLQSRQVTGTINGGCISEIIGGVCNSFRSNEFFTIQFGASYILSSDGKTGKVTTGSGILKTTYSNVFGYLSITGGTINIGVKPGLQKASTYDTILKLRF